MTTWEILRPLLPSFLSMVLIPAIGILLDHRARRVAREQLLDDAGKPKYALAHDLNGLGGKVDKIQTDVAETRKVAEEAAAGVRTIEEAQEHAALRLTEVVVEPMREIAATLRTIRDDVTKQGVELARQGEALKGLGRSVDDLRTQVQVGHRA